MGHEAGPPRIAELLALLEEHGVPFVKVGSAAAKIYGVDLEPGDLDIVPARHHPVLRIGRRAHVRWIVNRET